MEKLMNFTGGSILLTIGIICLAAIGLVIGTINVITKTVKNKDISKSQKRELVICIIFIIYISFFIGGLIGYEFGILRML